MAFQFAGQSTFTALGCAKRAIFFSLLRKVLIVVPLTLLLPGLGFGTDGVFLAEPISNVIGGLASFLTMYFTLYRRLPKRDDTPVSKEILRFLNFPKLPFFSVFLLCYHFFCLHETY